MSREQSGLWDYFKIGIATDVERRIAELQTGNPNLLSIESCWQFENAQAVETVLHQKYGKERIRGEWFKFTPSQVEEFDNLCNVLGGERHIPIDETAAIYDVEDAEEMAETFVSGKWDYAAMFADGWKMAATDGRVKYWCWRRRIGGSDELIYGGPISALPHPIDEMRRIYDANASTRRDKE